MSDEDMVAYLGHCMIDSKHPRASIETLLHAFLPFKHVDHTHPDAIISLCCAHNGKATGQRNFRRPFRMGSLCPSWLYAVQNDRRRRSGTIRKPSLC